MSRAAADGPIAPRGDPFAALADPTRRRVLELLAAGERTAGDVTTAIRAETGLSQPSVSQHLAVLRAAGLVTVRGDGPRRFYATRPEALHLVAAWVDHVLPSLEQPLDALATEVARGRRERRTPAGTGPVSTGPVSTGPAGPRSAGMGSARSGTAGARPRAAGA